MFDAISVPEATRRPWTVAGSFMGQVALVGLAIVIPLLSTEGLPRRMGWVGVPEPPRGRVARPPAEARVRTSVVPSQVYRRLLTIPTTIPPRALPIVDLAPLPSIGERDGVAGGTGGPGGSGSPVIDSLVSSLPVAVPPPPVVARKDDVKPIQRITVGGIVQAARLLSGPAPVYPPLARQARVSGVVRLAAVIARDGAIIDLRAISGHPLLIPAAMAAVERWVFRPTYLNGEPVEVATQIDVNFTLQ